MSSRFISFLCIIIILFILERRLLTRVQLRLFYSFLSFYTVILSTQIPPLSWPRRSTCRMPLTRLVLVCASKGSPIPCAFFPLSLSCSVSWGQRRQGQVQVRSSLSVANSRFQWDGITSFQSTQPFQFRRMQGLFCMIELSSSAAGVDDGWMKSPICAHLLFSRFLSTTAMILNGQWLSVLSLTHSPKKS